MLTRHFEVHVQELHRGELAKSSHYLHVGRNNQSSESVGITHALLLDDCTSPNIMAFGIRSHDSCSEWTRSAVEHFACALLAATFEAWTVLYEYRIENIPWPTIKNGGVVLFDNLETLCFSQLFV